MFLKVVDVYGKKKKVVDVNSYYSKVKKSVQIFGKSSLTNTLLQSLSLRRTIIERPNLGPGVPTNVSVTAILEKANAIRQVPTTIHLCT